MMKQKILKFVVRVPKEKANFVYFLLESHEGLIFHTTLDCDKHLGYRDILMMGSVTLEPEINTLFNSIRMVTPIEILDHDTISGI